MNITKSQLFSNAHKDAKAFMLMALFMTYRAAFSAALKAIYASQREQDEISELDLIIEETKAETERLKEENKALEAELEELERKAELNEAALTVLEAPKIKPTKVKVHWSESYVFENEQELDFEDFERRAYQVAKANGDVRENGYTKTKVTVFFEGNHEYQCRLDLALGDEVGFQDHMQQMIDCKKPEFVYLYKDNIEFAKMIDYSQSAHH